MAGKKRAAEQNIEREVTERMATLRRRTTRNYVDQSLRDNPKMMRELSLDMLADVEQFVAECRDDLGSSSAVVREYAFSRLQAVLARCGAHLRPGSVPKDVLLARAWPNAWERLDDGGRAVVGPPSKYRSITSWARAVLDEDRRMRADDKSSAIGALRYADPDGRLTMSEMRRRKRGDACKIVSIFWSVDAVPVALEHVLYSQMKPEVRVRLFRRMAHEAFPSWEPKLASCTDSCILEILSVWFDEKVGRKAGSKASDKQPKWERIAQWCAKWLDGPALSASALEQANNQYKRKWLQNRRSAK